MDNKPARFSLQLRILLWKNIIIKKRHPILTLLEILIPLVLFAVLLGIRRTQHAYPQNTKHYQMMPLPSAGIIPVLKSFCNDPTNNVYQSDNKRLTFLLLTVDILLKDGDPFSIVSKLAMYMSNSSPWKTKESLTLSNFARYLMTDPGSKLQALLTNRTRLIQYLEESYGIPSLTSETRIKQLLANNTLAMGNGYIDLDDYWQIAKPVLCGSDANQETGQKQKANNTEPKFAPSLSEQQKTIIEHFLFHNPKILYAPNNIAVNRIIQKVNETMKLCANVTTLARLWLNKSVDITDSIHQQLDQIPSDKQKEILAVVNNTVSILNGLSLIWIDLVGRVNLDIFKGFKTELELESYFLHKQYHDNVTVLAGLVFENLNGTGQELPAHIHYKIRQNATVNPPTNQVREPFWFPSPGSNNLLYYDFGFVWIQDMVERAIIDLHAGRRISSPGTFLHRMPYPCWLWDQFVWLIQHILPLCLMLSWVYPVAMLVQHMVYEKEKQLKEFMKMMGLTDSVHWCAWFCTAGIQMTVTVLILTAMLHLGHVLPYSNPFLVFIFLELFALSSMAFSFLISSIYSKAKLASACAGIFYFVTYVPYMYIAIREDLTGAHISDIVKTIVSFFSTSALGLGGKYFLFYELQGSGVQWDNLMVSPRENDHFNLMRVFIMLSVDTVLYFVLAWYIENILPGTYGIPKPWFFPFMCSYWTSKTIDDSSDVCNIERLFGIRTNAHKYTLVPEDDNSCHSQSSVNIHQYFEGENHECKVGVEVLNLRKVYKNGEKPALDGLSLKLYEDQITTLLGHNGAGKTTTMCILSGLYPPTSGSATIYGYDIGTSMDAVRQIVGICPQHNVLFDGLTVEEHLWFYQCLKGVSRKQTAMDISRMIQDLGLQTKRNSLPGALSGGMCRKLSIAIAFVGGSKTIILDEPTAGVDPYSRRAIWNLLTKYKKGRTILVSTHHLDEAEVLSDRILIIADGKLKCSGSPDFLKATLGDGYRLFILKDTSTTTNIISTHDKAKILDVIKRYVPRAYVAMENLREIQVILPLLSYEKHALIPLLEELALQKAELAIKSYGLSDSGLEQVFVKVTKSEVRNLNEIVSNDCHFSVNVSEELASLGECTIQPLDDDVLQLRPLHGCGLGEDLHSSDHGVLQSRYYFEQHFKAMMLKRLHYTLRNRKALISQIVLPSLFVAISMTIALSAPQYSDPEPLVMSPAQYHKITQPVGNFIPFSNNIMSNQSQDTHVISSNKIIATLFLPSGVGATCLLKSPFNNSLEMDFGQFRNESKHRLLLVRDYFINDCADVFTEGVSVETTAGNKDMILSSCNSDDFQPGHYYPQCQCKKDNVGFSCDSDGVAKPKEIKLVTGDLLQIITSNGNDDENYYLHTTDQYRLHRYGGFSFGNRLPYIPQSLKHIAKDSNNMHEAVIHKFSEDIDDILEAIVQKFSDDTNDTLESAFNTVSENVDGIQEAAVREFTKVWYSQKGFHSMPVYINTLNNAILRAALMESAGNPAAYGITLTNHPMKQTSNLLDTDYIQGGTDVLMAIFVIIAMSFVPASFVVFLVHERAIKAKHLQFISGLHPFVYWTANYIWDMCNYMIPAICIVVILLAFHIQAYVGKGNIEAVISLFIVYGWSITPMMYPTSFVFNEPSVAYVCLIVVNLFTGITCVITSFLLKLFAFDDNLSSLHDMLGNVFLIFPNYCLGDGLMSIALNHYTNEYYSHVEQYDKVRSALCWHITWKRCTAMATMGIISFIFTIMCEYKFWCSSSSESSSMCNQDKESTESDVQFERIRTLNGDESNSLLSVHELTKVFNTRKKGNVVAVNGLTFSVPVGECFGLLGVNGAGKTTTFRMLTHDLIPTSGDAKLLKYSLFRDKGVVIKKLGYCPQFDAVFNELTPREHLTLYARLRNIPPSHIKKVVDKILKMLGLKSYENKPSWKLSGGNKRKLSTAIALVGDPALILMDEPTTGMDPYSRTFIWNIIHQFVHSGHSVVFTSHSMEECEALCTRLSIMVNGQLRCLGSVQHLKDKYGDGYTLTLVLKANHHTMNIRDTHDLGDNDIQCGINMECGLLIDSIFEHIEYPSVESDIQLKSIGVIDVATPYNEDTVDKDDEDRQVIDVVTPYNEDIVDKDDEDRQSSAESVDDNGIAINSTVENVNMTCMVQNYQCSCSNFPCVIDKACASPKISKSIHDSCDNNYIEMSKLDCRMQYCNNYVVTSIPNCKLQYCSQNTMVFEIKVESSGLANILKVIEEIPYKTFIEDYSINQKTLDNMFIRFAAEQHDLENHMINEDTQPGDISDDELLNDLTAMSLSSASYDDVMVHI